MKNEKNLINLHVSYWETAAERDWNTACDLYTTKHYDACLFFCHLTIEKMLKALVVRVAEKAAPYTHDLVLLARLAKLPLSAVQGQLLHTITTFNISGRYDDYKLQFYKRATASYTKKFLTKTNTLYVWLQKKD